MLHPRVIYRVDLEHADHEILKSIFNSLNACSFVYSVQFLDFNSSEIEQYNTLIQDFEHFLIDCRKSLKQVDISIITSLSESLNILTKNLACLPANSCPKLRRELRIQQTRLALLSENVCVCPKD